MMQKKWQIVFLLSQILAYGSLSITPVLRSLCVAFIVPRTVCASTKCDSAILKMVRRPEPAVAVEDEKFFLRFQG